MTAEDEFLDPGEAIRGLFVIMPTGGTLSAADLQRVLETTTVVGVLLPDAPHDVSEIITVCRSQAVAAFVRNPDQVIGIGATGVLVDAVGEVEPARAGLGQNRLIGARAGVSRHAAMVAGEAGVDFIAFGDFDHPINARLTEIVRWWADLFVLPSLALAASLDPDGARRLKDAGTDFLGVLLDRLGAEPEAAVRLAEAFGAGPRA